MATSLSDISVQLASTVALLAPSVVRSKGRHHSVSSGVVGRDPATDLALLRVEGAGLKTPPGHDADDLAVGHLVLALGRPGQGIRALWGIVGARAGGRGRAGQPGREGRDAARRARVAGCRNTAYFSERPVERDHRESLERRPSDTRPPAAGGPS